MLTQRNSKLTINEAKYSRMDQVKFVEDSLWNIWSDRVCWDPFLNTLPQICQNIITMPFSSYYNVYVKAISDILLLFGSSNSQGFTSNIKISRFITYPHDKYNHFFFLSISFSPKYFHSVQNQNPLSSTNVLACMSPFPKYWSDRNTCFESNDHSSKLEPHVNLKADFPHHPFTAQHYFSIINVKFTLRKIL